MRRWLIYLACVPALTACAFRPVYLEPGWTALLDIGLRPGADQVIEIDVQNLARPGAELRLKAGGRWLPPVYLTAPDAPAHGAIGALTAKVIGTLEMKHIASEKHEAYAARLWSALWPLDENAMLSITNVGPSPVTLARVEARQGMESELFTGHERYVPHPPLGWVDVKELIQTPNREGIGNEDAARDVAPLAAWLAQRQRRQAFQHIAGLPLAMSMEEPVTGDVQVHGYRLGGNRGAVVAFSRPDRSAWRPLGPDWLPEADESHWTLLEKQRPLRQAFQCDSSLETLAFFVAPAADAANEPARLVARIYRAESSEPEAVVRWTDLPSEGKWLWHEFSPPLAAGDFVLELQATAGKPAWLGWRTEASGIKAGGGARMNRMNRTLIVQEIDNAGGSGEALTVRAQVMGFARKIEHYAGATVPAKPYESEVNETHMSFEARLAPGQTEIFYLRLYQPDARR